MTLEHTGDGKDVVVGRHAAQRTRRVAPRLRAGVVVLAALLGYVLVSVLGPAAAADARTTPTSTPAPASSTSASSGGLLPIDITLGTGLPVRVALGGIHLNVQLPDLGGLLGRPASAPAPTPSRTSVHPTPVASDPVPSSRSTSVVTRRSNPPPATTSSARAVSAAPVTSSAAPSTRARPTHRAPATHRARQQQASLLSQAITPGSPAMVLISITLVCGLGVAGVVLLGGRRRAAHAT